MDGESNGLLRILLDASHDAAVCVRDLGRWDTMADLAMCICCVIPLPPTGEVPCQGQEAFLGRSLLIWKRILLAADCGGNTLMEAPR
jgi:hypothetical protein